MMTHRSKALIFICLAVYTQSNAIWPFTSDNKNKRKDAQKTTESYPEYSCSPSRSKKYQVITEHAHLKNDLSSDAVQFLSLFGVKKEEFTHFKGTLQQCEINDFLIDVINQSCAVNKLLTQETNVAQFALIDATLKVHALNKQGQIEKIGMLVESLIENKEEYIAQVRSLIENQDAEDSSLWFTVLNSITNDLVIYSTQLITLASLEATLNQFLLPKTARTERLETLYHLIKQEFFAIYHPVTKHQEDTIEDVLDFAKQLALSCHEQFLNSIIVEKQYRTLK